MGSASLLALLAQLQRVAFAGLLWAIAACILPWQILTEVGDQNLNMGVTKAHPTHSYRVQYITVQYGMTWYCTMATQHHDERSK